jgi:hypothetical protein
LVEVEVRRKEAYFLVLMAVVEAAVIQPAILAVLAAKEVVAVLVQIN